MTIGSEPNQTNNCGPSVYANNLLGYISAIKAADSPADTSMTTAQMLATPTDISGIVSTLKSEITQYAGVNAANVPILVTETDNTIAQDTMPGALFSADMYMSWLENGVANVDWWDQHNGPGTPSVVDGARDYGDGGMFSSGANGSAVTEPPLDTPFDSYYGVEMLARLEAPGDQTVSSSSGDALVRVHANLTYNGFTPSGSPTVSTLANNAKSITSTTQSSATSVTVAPYTLTAEASASDSTAPTAGSRRRPPSASTASSARTTKIEY